ncbi:hypothetical protein [Nonomuraea guangzhouensis]|uniref:ESX-1 secretion-associated protein n=1 Tax=Nonomuraea guangzhouensis TaxID=1291555 RepID=A0ABW4GE27_9ACTN|nr:hypothetical protein [Nonomuraea guangzhouensis]
MKYHRDALDGCGTAAKDASGAFAEVAGSVSGAAIDQAAFGGLANAGALAAAVSALKDAAGTTSRTLGDHLLAVERALDAVERTFTGADGAAVRR